jgi:hypothetical protein
MSAISIYAIFFQSALMMFTFTDGILTFCLVTSTVNALFVGSFSLTRKIRSFTFVHFGQRIFFTASDMLKSFVFCQSISTIASNGRSPAIAAGVPLKTSWTWTYSSFFWTAAPIHSNSSCHSSCDSKVLFCSMVKYSVYGSLSASTNPLIHHSRIHVKETLSLS